VAQGLDAATGAVDAQRPRGNASQAAGRHARALERMEAVNAHAQIEDELMTALEHWQVLGVR
jgi:hypothetical protein